MKTCKDLYDLDNLKHLRTLTYEDALNWKIDTLTKIRLEELNKHYTVRDFNKVKDLSDTIEKTKLQLEECS